jgi:iron(III) transport system substrate-binding protein
MLLAIGISSVASAQTDGNAPQITAQVAQYDRSDRQTYLLEGARKEGVVSIYHSMPAEHMTVVAAAFTQKYGIKVKVWRSGSEAVLQRIVTEARGGRFEVDLAENNSLDNEALHRERLLQPVISPFTRDLIAQASPAHKEWVGTAIHVWVAAYNTDRVKKDELPKTYQDLLDPRWKNRLGIEVDNYAWFSTLTAALGEPAGTRLFSEIVGTNGISTRKGHSLLTNLVASGEVPFALTTYSYMPEGLKKKGAPVDWIALPPTVALFQTVSLLKTAPHPHAAMLFYDFLITEGQALLMEKQWISTSKNSDQALAKLPLKFVDAEKMLDGSAKYIKAYEDMVTRKGTPDRFPAAPR